MDYTPANDSSGNNNMHTGSNVSDHHNTAPRPSLQAHNSSTPSVSSSKISQNLQARVLAFQEQRQQLKRSTSQKTSTNSTGTQPQAMSPTVATPVSAPPNPHYNASEQLRQHQHSKLDSTLSPREPTQDPFFTNVNHVKSMDTGAQNSKLSSDSENFPPVFASFKYI
ncbi:hypothetical protein ACO0QE_001325 [Hanseniaspora vineae]